MNRARLKKYGSYASVFFAKLLPSLTSFLSIPLLVHYLGPEAYSLFAIYATLLAFGRILDLCITTITTREVARHSAGGDAELPLSTVISTLLAPQIGIAVLTVVLALAMAGPIARNMHPRVLTTTEVQLAISMMGLRMAADIMASYWTSVLIGMERLQIFSNIQIGFQLVLFGALVGTAFVTHSIVWVLASQIAVGVVRNGVLVYFVRGGLNERLGTSIHFNLLRSNIGFFGSTALAYGVGALFLLLDRVIAMRYLPLAEYGGYAITGQISGLFFLAVTPIYPIILPKLSKLIKLGRGEEALQMVWRVQRATVAILAPLLLWVLADDRLVANTVVRKPIYNELIGACLPWLVVGTVAFSLSEHLFTLQSALGNRRTNLKVNGTMAVAYAVTAIVVLRLRGGDPRAFLAVPGLWMGFQIAAWVVQSMILPRQVSPGARGPTKEILYAVGAFGCAVLMWKGAQTLHLGTLSVTLLSALLFGAIVATSPTIRHLADLRPGRIAPQDLESTPLD